MLLEVGRHELSFILAAFAKQLAAKKILAITNGWAFVDNYTPMSDWANFIATNGFNADDTIHLNAKGRLYSGCCVIRQLGMVDQLAAAGVLRPTSFLSAL